MKPELVVDRIRSTFADMTVGIAAIVGAARAKRTPRELEPTATLRDGSRVWRTQISP